MKYSRSQNLEDIVLARALAEVDKGFYIDVGANDPTVDSVTHEFYNAGWRGINIEPVDEFYARLCSDRKHDINLKICAGAVDEQSVELLTVAGTGLTTNSLSMKETIEDLGFATQTEISQSKRLDSIWREHASGQVHFLKIDVEGMEEEVLKGIDLSLYRPWIIVIEAVTPIDMKPSHLEWEEMITSNNYRFVYFDGLNRFYLANEHEVLEARFKTPPNITDELLRGVLDMRTLYPSILKDKTHLQKEISRISEDFISENRILNQKALSLTEEVVQMLYHQKEIEDRYRNFQALEEANEHLNAKFLAVNHNLHLSNQQLDQILNSKLWASTYPYRRARELLKIFAAKAIYTSNLIVQTVVFFRHHGLRKTVHQVKTRMSSAVPNNQSDASDESTPNSLSQGEKDIYETLKGKQ